MQRLRYLCHKIFIISLIKPKMKITDFIKLVSTSVADSSSRYIRLVISMQHWQSVRLVWRGDWIEIYLKMGLLVILTLFLGFPWIVFASDVILANVCLRPTRALIPSRGLLKTPREGRAPLSPSPLLTTSLAPGELVTILKYYFYRFKNLLWCNFLGCDAQMSAETCEMLYILSLHSSVARWSRKIS